VGRAVVVSFSFSWRRLASITLPILKNRYGRSDGQGRTTQE
jgi:hypothetical protein